MFCCSRVKLRLLVRFLRIALLQLSRRRVSSSVHIEASGSRPQYLIVFHLRSFRFVDGVPTFDINPYFSFLLTKAHQPEPSIHLESTTQYDFACSTNNQDFSVLSIRRTF